MLRVAFLLTAAGLGLLTLAAERASSQFSRRWDLTVTTPNATYPSWLHVDTNAASPVVEVVGRVASVHPATEVVLKENRLSFTTSEWFGKPTRVTWELAAHDQRITGMQHRADGVDGRIEGQPAPALDRPDPASWGTPQPLFDGTSLTGWVPDDPANNHWQARNGELLNAAPGANIRTERKFDDFKLHIEFNCPQNGNSGIYLRGRYEVQVEYERPGVNDALHQLGSIYGFLAPSVALPPRPGTWESFDVTLVGRHVTVIRNGVKTIDRKEIPGITGGALDSNEAAPGPLYIQGDHTGGMKYRNIRITTSDHAA